MKAYQDNGWGEVCANTQARIEETGRMITEFEADNMVSLTYSQECKTFYEKPNQEILPTFMRILADDNRRLRSAQEFEAINICKLLNLN